MAQPTPYDRQFSFQDFQAQEPTTPLPGAEVDGELNSVKVTIDQTLVNLAKIQRDDGALKNGIVTQDSLSSSLSIGFTLRGPWESGVNYVLGDGASYDSKFYRALSAHLSTSLNRPDLDAAIWEEVADFAAVSADAAASAAEAAASALAASGSATAASDSASAASGSALAASGSADAAAASADAAEASADAAAASALEAANTVGDATDAVRWDVAQSLSAGEQLQARQNVGISTAGSDLVTAANLAAQQALLGVGSVGQCYLSKVSANLVLKRINGVFLPINGRYEIIPSVGVSLAATGLTPSTLYYIYAYMNAGTMTLEASTTTHATDTATGVEIKSGDATRTLVGMAYCVTGPAWATDDNTRIGCLSWFNRRLKSAYTILSANQTITGTSLANVTAFETSFLCWGDTSSRAFAQGGWTVTGAAIGDAILVYDGNHWAPGYAETTSVTTTSMALAGSLVITEGAHIASIWAMRTSGTNVIFQGTGNSKCSVTVEVMG